MWWANESTVAAQARALEASYPARRAAAIEELKIKLRAHLAQRVLHKAEQGKQRCIVYFDQLYGSDLHQDCALERDFNEAEEADLQQCVAAWCAEQGLQAQQSKHNPNKLFLRWADVSATSV